MYTKLTLKKLTDNPKVGDKTPSHALIAANNDFTKKVKIGAMWLRQGEYGQYLSGQLNDEPRTWKDKDGNEHTDEAYVIISRKDYDDLLALKQPKVVLTEKEEGHANLDNIPF